MSARTKILAHCFSNIYAWVTGQPLGAPPKPKHVLQPVVLPELHEISEILPSCLYLSGAAALTTEKLRSLGITAIVCALTETEEKHVVSSSYASLTIPKRYVRVLDSETSDISVHFDPIGKFVDDEINRGGKVLIHCMAGISRSASLVIAYLIRYKNFSLMDAYDYVADRRRVIQPNDGFFVQLARFERRFKTAQKLAVVNELSDEATELEEDVLPEAVLTLSLKDEAEAIPVN